MILYGSNLGDDVLYSGTVAAATEGRFLGKTAVAISLNTDGLRGDDKRHFETGAHFARVIVERLQAAPLNRPHILNVNEPNNPVNEVKGIKVTRIGFGLPSGGGVLYADSVTLKSALEGRRAYS